MDNKHELNTDYGRINNLILWNNKFVTPQNVNDGKELLVNLKQFSLKQEINKALDLGNFIEFRIVANSGSKTPGTLFTTTGSIDIDARITTMIIKGTQLTDQEKKVLINNFKKGE